MNTGILRQFTYLLGDNGIYNCTTPSYVSIYMSLNLVKIGNIPKDIVLCS